MKSLTAVLVLLLHVVGIAVSVSAADTAEAAKLLDQWMQAWRSGDAAALGTQYADDASLTNAVVPFRIEGREAIQASWVGSFQAFPTRQLNLRQVSTRVYGNGTVAAHDGYFHAILVDRNGKPTTLLGRFTIAWVKSGGRWQIIAHHTSSVPPSQ